MSGNKLAPLYAVLLVHNCVRYRRLLLLQLLCFWTLSAILFKHTSFWRLDSVSGPEMVTRSIRFHLKSETESILRNVVCLNRTMDNVQKHYNCIHIPSSQTFRPCLSLRFLLLDRMWCMNVKAALTARKVIHCWKKPARCMQRPASCCCLFETYTSFKTEGTPRKLETATQPQFP
jgi:hypothetical protein